MTTKHAVTHSPTPWKVGNVGMMIWTDDLRELVASVEKDTTEEVRKANAAFIVRVVNSHDALVQAAHFAATNPGVPLFVREQAKAALILAGEV